MLLTFIILTTTILLFISGKLRSDLVAILSLLALFLSGVLDTQQTLAGFADTTVVMIAALFVVGEGLSQTGVTAWAGDQLLKLAGSSQVRLLTATMAGTALLSAFISNTGTVATLMPAIVAAAWSIGSIPARFLMPVAFAANTGGLLTLTGTPPNIVVADTLTAAGLTPFNYFEYGYIGLPLLITAIVYMLFIGQRLLPSRAAGERPVDAAAALTELAQSYALPDNIFQLRVRSGSGLVGQTLEQAGLGRDYNLSVLQVEHLPPTNSPSRRRRPVRDNLEKLRRLDTHQLPGPETVIAPGDILLVKGGSEAIEQVMTRFNLALQPFDSADRNEDGVTDRIQESLLSRELGLAEVLLTPRSDYIGRTITQGQFGQKFQVHILSIRRQGRPVDRRRVKLAFGDSLLVRGAWAAISLLQNDHRNFVVVGSPQEMARQLGGLAPQALTAVTALIGMIFLMVTGWTPTVMAALIAAAVMVLGRCLSMEQAYRAVSWSSVILIAAMIPMSTALQITGGAELIAGGLVNTLGTLHPLALMAGVFLLTTGFSQVINNTATAVLVAPIVLQAALDLGVSPYPMLMIVAVSASTAFLTPIGTTTNLMVLSPGGYGFNDYIKTGLPLMLLFLAISLVLVPIIWPL